MTNYEYLLSIMTDEQLEEVNRLNANVARASAEIYRYYEDRYSEAVESGDADQEAHYLDLAADALADAEKDRDEWIMSVNEYRRRANVNMGTNFPMLKNWQVQI